MNYGLHVIKNPRGTYSYAGTIPSALATIVVATTSDVMGGRVLKERGPRGEIMSYRFPVFNSREAAIAFAESHGHAVINEEESDHEHA